MLGFGIQAGTDSTPKSYLASARDSVHVNRARMIPDLQNGKSITVCGHDEKRS